MRTGIAAPVPHCVAGFPITLMPNTAKTPAAGADVSIEDLTDGGTTLQVGPADDAGCDAARSIESGSAHGRDTIDEFRLPNNAQMLRSAGSIHGAALDEHRGDDVVTGVHVEQDVVQQITMSNPLMAKLP